MPATRSIRRLSIMLACALLCMTTLSTGTRQEVEFRALFPRRLRLRHEANVCAKAG